MPARYTNQPRILEPPLDDCSLRTVASVQGYNGTMDGVGCNNNLVPSRVLGSHHLCRQQESRNYRHHHCIESQTRMPLQTLFHQTRSRQWSLLGFCVPPDLYGEVQGGVCTRYINVHLQALALPNKRPSKSAGAVATEWSKDANDAPLVITRSMASMLARELQ